MRWQNGTITQIVRRSPGVSSFFFHLAKPFVFQAGQHVDVRLTAPDGYYAQRSYSIASAPGADGRIELTIEALENGEVSPFFHDVAAVGDEIEMRGPIGGHFIWSPADGGPVLLIGGGSGIVPLMSMIRLRAQSGSKAPMRLLFSVRTKQDILFEEELRDLSARNDGFDAAITLTRDASPPAGMFKGRIDAAMIASQFAALPGPPTQIYICGSNAFVANAADHVLDVGIEPSFVKTERYGV